MINLLKHFNSKRTRHEPFVAFQGVPTPIWTQDRYDSLADEGFKKNIIAFRAITLISKNIASIPFSISSTNTNTQHCIKKLLDNHSSHINLLETIANYLLVSGNAYVHLNESQDLHCLRPDRIQIVPNNSHTKTESFVYSINSQKFTIHNNNILHLKFFNPLNDWYGFSPLQAAAQSIDQYNAMSKHNIAILQNGGRPSGCLCINNGLENLSDEQRDQLRSNIKNAYAGTNNAGKIMILEGDFQWKEMGLSPKDLDFDSSKNITAREIAIAFGVPPMLIGIQGDSAYSNYKEARLLLWEDTILPLAEYIKNELSSWLSMKFNCKCNIVFDLDSIHALSSKRETMWNKISNATFLSNEEKRSLLGYTTKE